MKIINYSDEDFEKRIQSHIERRSRILDGLQDEADDIINEYRESGEESLLGFAKRFDHVELEKEELWVDPDQIRNAHKLVSLELRKSVDLTIERVQRFQTEMRPTSFQTEEEAGVYWGVEVRALDRVGVYIPRGYFLTLVLCAVPARIAGVDELIVATPPVKSFGKPYVDPAILYAAKALNIDKVLISGGVGALAALAFGTDSTPPVEKIVGPSGKLGLAAKQRLNGYVGIDGLIGPAEVAFVCDATSSTESVAADMIGIADRNPEAEIYVFQSKEKWLEALLEEVVNRVQNLKTAETREGVRHCLESNTHLFYMDSFEQTLRYINRLAPGVTCLRTKNAADHIDKITATGSLLLGQYTPPVSLDLIGGAIGLVGTLGAAGFSTLSSPETYVRRFGVVELQKEALLRLQKNSLEMAKAEGFSTYEEVFSSRLDK